MSDTTAVWFDLDGTLVTIADYAAVIERACAAVGIEGAERTTFVEAYDTAFLEAFSGLDAQPYQYAARVGIDAADVTADPEAFVEALLDAECASGQVPQAVWDALDRLEGHQLGVLTNGIDEWQREKLARHGLADRFDAVVVSEEAGAHKPDRAVFELAGGRLDADVRWMVGDDREADVDGARAAGWQAVHVDTPAELPAAVERILE